MLKNALVTVTTTVLLLAMLTACAEDDQSENAASKAADTSKAMANTQAAEDKPKRSKRPERVAPKEAAPQKLEAFQSAAIMSKPVDFSSPENVTASFQAIQKEAGDEASSRVKNAINYMLVYDLSVGRNKQKLYEKLNGKTPNEIMAMTGR